MRKKAWKVRRNDPDEFYFQDGYWTIGPAIVGFNNATEAEVQLIAEAPALRTELAASRAEVAALRKTVASIAIPLEALNHAERGGLALTGEMQDAILMACKVARAALDTKGEKV